MAGDPLGNPSLKAFNGPHNDFSGQVRALLVELHMKLVEEHGRCQKGDIPERQWSPVVEELDDKPPEDVAVLPERLEWEESPARLERTPSSTSLASRAKRSIHRAAVSERGGDEHERAREQVAEGGESPDSPVGSVALDVAAMRSGASHASMPFEAAAENNDPHANLQDNVNMMFKDLQDSMSKAPPWLQVWPDWTKVTSAQVEGGKEGALTARGDITKYLKMGTKSFQDKAVVSGDVITGTSVLFQTIVMFPSSPSRVCWEFISVVVLTYDVIVIPMETLFGQAEYNFDDEKVFETSPIFSGISVATTIFWTVDIFAALCTGYHRKGILETRFLRIAVRYLQSWFVFDFLIVLLDWVLLLAGGEAAMGSLRTTKSLRVARALRMLRLLRLIKVANFTIELDNFIRSQSLLIMLGIIKLIVAVVVMNHYIGCMWFFLGARSVEPAWVAKLVVREQRRPEMAYFYFTSLHWSLTQFTPASMEVSASNVTERIFSVSVIIVALVVFSSVVSSITNATSHLRKFNQEQLQQEEYLRRYITENRVSFKVGSLIYGYIRHRYQNRSRVHENDVLVLTSLPNMLQMQLRTEVYSPALMKHPWFFHIQSADKEVLIDICHNALDEQSLVSGSELFARGEQCSKVFFLVLGSMDYYYDHDTRPEEVEVGDHCCEATLWVQWMHRGRLLAPNPGELMVLDAACYRKTLDRAPGAMGCARDYARMFVKNLFEKYNEGLRICDLQFDLETSFDMATSTFEKHYLSLGRTSSYVPPRLGRYSTLGSFPGVGTRKSVAWVISRSSHRGPNLSQAVATFDRAAARFRKSQA